MCYFIITFSKHYITLTAIGKIFKRKGILKFSEMQEEYFTQIIPHLDLALHKLGCYSWRLNGLIRR